MPKTDRGSRGAGSDKDARRARRRRGVAPTAVATPPMPAPAVVADDPWARERALVAERLGELTTADAMRLFTAQTHPRALLLDVRACPDVAEFKPGFADEVVFTMGAVLKEHASSTTGVMAATATGVVRGERATFHALHQVNWDSGDRHDLPLLIPIAEIETRFRQNQYAMSVSLEGLAGVQLDRTRTTMRDILDGFMLAHRGLTVTEVNRRYDGPTAKRINGVMAACMPYTPAEDGRNPDWHGWADMPVDKTRRRSNGLRTSAKDAQARHAKGLYGTGGYIIPRDEYEKLKVNPKAETRETLALLKRVLGSTNLPTEAEHLVLSAMETLVVQRGKGYASRDD